MTELTPGALAVLDRLPYSSKGLAGHTDGVKDGEEWIEVSAPVSWWVSLLHRGWTTEQVRKAVFDEAEMPGRKRHALEFAMAVERRLRGEKSG